MTESGLTGRRTTGVPKGRIRYVKHMDRVTEAAGSTEIDAGPHPVRITRVETLDASGRATLDFARNAPI